MKRLMAMKKAMKNKKGFTLIEIIVVLVILAILAAATIPTMIGFVNDARGKADLANARLVLTTTQGAISQYPLNTADIVGTVRVNNTGVASISFNRNGTPTENTAKAVTAFATLLGTDLPSNDGATVKINGDNKVTEIAYKSKSNNKTIIIDALTKEVRVSP